MVDSECGTGGEQLLTFPELQLRQCATDMLDRWTMFC